MGTLGLIGAAPASAATVNLTVDCQTDTTLSANIGDTIIITMGPTCTLSPGRSMWNGNGKYNPLTATASGFFTEPSSYGNSPSHGIQSLVSGPVGQRDWYAYSAGGGTTQITTTLAATDGGGNPLVVGSIVAAHGDGAPVFLIRWAGPPTAGGTTPPWVQAYGRASKDAACDKGWNPSWQSWAEKVTGGWVCTRDIPSLG